jgi:hypothetical protein
MSHTHLHDGVPFHGLLVQIIPPAVEGFGHIHARLISSPELFDDLPQKKNSCCGTVRLHRKGMSKDLKPKTLILKRGDIRVKTRGDLTAMVWKEKRVVYLLTFTIHPEKAIIAMNMGMQ